MGELGNNRVVNELEWQYEAPKLLAANAYTIPPRRSGLAREIHRRPRLANRIDELA